MKFIFLVISTFLFAANAQAQSVQNQNSNISQPPLADNVPQILPSPPIAYPPPPAPIRMPCGLMDFQARPISLGKFATHPTYPQRAINDGVFEARLYLDVTVNDRGRVTHVEVINSTAPGYFEQAAIEDAQTMRFQPAMTNCQMSEGHYRRYVRYAYR